MLTTPDVRQGKEKYPYNLFFKEQVFEKLSLKCVHMESEYIFSCGEITFNEKTFRDANLQSLMQGFANDSMFSFLV